MRISIQDASNYYRGLLLLIRKDKKVTQVETDLMLRIGRTLGFEKGFCENAIQEILENEYIADTPPEFSSRELAIKFVNDGLTIVFADAEVHPAEEHWLKSTAQKNGLDMEFYSRVRETAVKQCSPPTRLEVDELQVQYS